MSGYRRTLHPSSSRQYRVNVRDDMSTTEKNTIGSHRKIVNGCVSALRYFGLWAPHSNSSLVLKTLYAFYNKLVLAILCTFVGALAADLVLSYGDLVVLTDDGCFLAAISVVLMKIFNFQLNRERIQNLIDAVHEPVETLRCSSDPVVVSLVENVILVEKILVYSFSGAGSFLVIAIFLSVPTESGSLPIRTKYPFDTTTRPMYTVAFAIEASAVTTAMGSILAMDAIVLGFCRFVHLQLQILGSNYENCQSSKSSRGYLESRKDVAPKKLFESDDESKIRCFVPFSAKEVNEIDDDFAKRFKTCVRHHQRLIRIIDEMNELFSSSMLGQVCASSAIICLTAFQSALGSNGSEDIMKFMLLLGVAFGHLFYWCWIGNNIIYESDYLAVGQWFSGWEDEKNLSTAAVLMIMSLIRTRRSMALTAGSFYTVSMETFLGILRGSYSFYAVLTTVNDEDEGSN